LDEAWIFLRNRTIRDYITHAEKTWRKKNAAMILATQSVHELVQSDMLAVVNECCATKIFLANPSIDHRLYEEIFHLIDSELDLLGSLVPKRDLDFWTYSYVTANKMPRTIASDAGLSALIPRFILPSSP